MMNFFLEISKVGKQRFLIFIIVEILAKCWFEPVLGSSVKIANSKHSLLLFQQRIKQIVNFQLAKPVFKVVVVSIIEARFGNLGLVIFLVGVLS